MNPHRTFPPLISRILRLLLLGGLPLGMVLLVTAGTVRDPVLPPPADHLETMLERMDHATERIARHLSASAVPVDWEAAAAETVEEAPAAEAEAPEPAEPVVVVPAGPPIDERVEKLRLEGIAWNPETPVAFISRKTLVLDGEIEGLRVAYIGPDSVMFEDEWGHTQNLRLHHSQPLMQARND